jgi:methylase of polypeptide subunit release factors
LKFIRQAAAHTLTVETDMNALQERWYSASGASVPKRFEVVNDNCNADTAYRLACAGTAMLWQGDFQQARQLLQALTRRVARSSSAPSSSLGMPQAFHTHRMAQAQRARLLAMLVLHIESDYTIALRRAPDVRDALCSAWGEASGHARVISLRELLGIVSAYEWQRKGMAITALSAEGFKLHPRYGVFSPVRSEYLDLIAKAPLPSTALAFDIGTGTGVVAALLVMRGVKHVIATDNSEIALRCAQENFQRLGLSSSVECVMSDVFPLGQASLIVCNPPWLPGKATSLLEHAIYDPDSRMLRRFLAQVKSHLTPQGQAWLVLSDLAEHLKLRSRAQLLEWIEQGGLQVLGRDDIRPRHPKALDTNDVLHSVRAQEVTSLWRLGVRAA